MIKQQAITILGATGSIGASTLDLVRQHPERYRVYALSGYQQLEKLAELCAEFKPQVAVVPTADAAQTLQKYSRQQNISLDIVYGESALAEVAKADASDILVAAIVGSAGLMPVLAAARAGKKILLANKEALVMSGQLLMDTVKQYKATLIPIDSEHSAIFQILAPTLHAENCLEFVDKIILTASGGPFLKRPVESLDNVTPEEAIAHPNWKMGQKISVDSATMMNKSLEVIEAYWLFGAKVEQIDVVIHPQSIVHSMIAYRDGSMLAQLGNPDMRSPIAYALAYPERISSGVASLDFSKTLNLQFEKPDFTRFRCLQFCYQVLREGGTASAILNAANEIAVTAFLNRKIGFRAIDDLIAKVLDRSEIESATQLDTIFAADQRTRQITHQLIAS